MGLNPVESWSCGSLRTPLGDVWVNILRPEHQNRPVTAGVLVVACGASFITRGSCQQAVGSGLSWTRAAAVLQDTV